MERAIILSRNGRLDFDLPDAPVAHKASPKQAGVSAAVLTEADMRKQERDNIVFALRQCAGKVSGKGGAAELLEMKPTTLASRITAFGIVAEEFAEAR
jgi:formate hydrogenlyase transcriptional activator